MKYIYLFISVLLTLTSCGENILFDENDDYKAWSFYNENDTVIFKSSSFMDTMVIKEKTEILPKYRYSFGFEHFNTAIGIHDVISRIKCDFQIKHHGFEMPCFMSVRKEEKGEFAIFSFSSMGIIDYHTHVNELSEYTINGITFNDCVVMSNDSVLFPGRYVYPVELDSACWSKSAGLLFYTIDSVAYYNNSIFEQQ